MRVLGLVLDASDLEMYARNRTEMEEGPRKKANLMKRLRRRAPEMFHRTLWASSDFREYERKSEATTIWTTLPEATPTEEKTVDDVLSVASSPPKSAKRPISPISSPPRTTTAETTTPPVAESIPRRSCESPEIEMRTSPPKVRTSQNVAEEEETVSPLVIPASPIEADAMEESPFKPKRSRSPHPPQPVLPPNPPGPFPVPAVPVVPLPRPQAQPRPPPPQPPSQVPMQPPGQGPPQGPPRQPVQGAVAGRRRLRVSRSRRTDEMETATNSMEALMDHGSMQIHPSSFQAPTLSSSSFGHSAPTFSQTSLSQPSFSNPSTPGSFFGSQTPSFSSQSGSDLFSSPSPSNPFTPPSPVVPQPAGSSAFRPMQGFGSTSSVAAPTFGASGTMHSPPVFQARPPPQPSAAQTAFQPPANQQQQQQQPFMPNSEVSFSFGRQPTPSRSRSRSYARRKSRNN